MKCKKLLLASVLSVVLVGATACSMPKHGADVAEAALRETSTPQSPATLAQPVKGSALIVASAKVEPIQSAELNFPTSGVVAEVLVKEGDRVEKDAPLVRLDLRDLELGVAQAKAALAQANANYHKLVDGATPQEISAAKAQVRQAEAELRQTNGSVTRQDIAAAGAAVDEARAKLAQLQAGPKSVDVQIAQAALDQATANLQTQRDSLSAAKTNAQLQMQQATTDLTKAQSAYATAKQNWQYIEDTGNDPGNPTTTDASGKRKANKLNDTQRQQYYAALVQAEAAMHSAEIAVQQAQVAFDTARGTEVSGIATAEAQVRNAQASLDKLQLGSEKDELAAARAQVAQAEANLSKLQGDQRAGTIAAAQAGVADANANLERLAAPPRAAEIADAEAKVQQAQVSLKQAELSLDKATLRAPLAGVIAAVNVKAGEIPRGDMPVVVIADTSAWQIKTDDLTELDVVPIHMTAPVTITFDAIPGLELPGRVSNIKALGEKKEGDMTYTVTVAPDRLDDRLKWNMSATVSIAPEIK